MCNSFGTNKIRKLMKLLTVKEIYYKNNKLRNKLLLFVD